MDDERSTIFAYTYYLYSKDSSGFLVMCILITSCVLGYMFEIDSAGLVCTATASEAFVLKIYLSKFLREEALKILLLVEVSKSF